MSRSPAAGGLVALAFAVAFAGCATYVQRYETVGGRGAAWADWHLTVFSGYENGRIVSVSASTPDSAGPRALVDQLLLVDSLVVTVGDPLRRQVLAPDAAWYSWSTDSTAEGTGARYCPESYRLDLIGDDLGIAWHRHTRIDPALRPGYDQVATSDTLLAVITPPCPVGPARAPAPAVLPGRLAPLDSVLAAWLPRNVVLEVTFPPYDLGQSGRVRRLTFHLRAIDRRTGRTVAADTVAWRQEKHGRWELWTGY